ncbi:MAG: acyl-CoA ligase (AMP-forming), exosortase A system-associated [Halorhodospira sp.]
MPWLLHDLLLHPAHQHMGNIGLRQAGGNGAAFRYAELAEEVARTATALREWGLEDDDRVAVYLEKRPEAIIALFGISAAGGIAVPVNPVLKPPQVTHILQDAGASALITSPLRLHALASHLTRCPALHTAVRVAEPAAPDITLTGDLAIRDWAYRAHCLAAPLPRRVESDLALLLYTSGSTGMPKGVSLSHRNLVAGASSVVAYLENTEEDRILAALPLSFDYGFSQLTTAFLVGAEAVLTDYLLPRELPQRVAAHGITGLAAVPPMWIDLAEQPWPEGARRSLRYLTNSGGVLPQATQTALRAQLPDAQLFLMYGLTEAFRSTYLAPEDLDQRPGSIGRAIPNAEVQVVRPDGTPCDPYEHGELVHRGPQVALGYWGAPEATAGRFRPAPNRPAGVPTDERAVWSGDTVYSDEEGYLYFVGRQDELIKTSGYRVSPQEIEAALMAIEGVRECVAAGIPDPRLGEAIGVALAVDPEAGLDASTLERTCRQHLPTFMTPATFWIQDGPLPRNAHGKIDRAKLRAALLEHAGEGTP